LLSCALAACGNASASEEPTALALYERALREVATGQLEAAEADLESLILMSPEHAGAWLDLAMVKCSQGHPEPARALLDAVESRFDPPAAVRDLIRLERARACYRSDPARSSWALKWARGVDSNVNQGTTTTSLDVASDLGTLTLNLTSDYLPRPDQWSALGADWAAPVGSGGAMAFARMHLRGYDTEHAFDQLVSTVGLEVPWQWAGWAWRASQSLGWGALGGAPNQRSARLHLQALRPLGDGPGWEGGAGLGWARLSYPALGGFDASQVEARALLGYRGALLQTQAGLGAAYDQGGPQRPGGDRRGLSAGASVRGPVAGGAWADASVSLQVWDGSAPYFPGIIDACRHQEALTTRLGVTVPLGPGHSVRLELSDLRSRDSVPIFAFSSRQVGLTWEWLP